VIITWRSTGRQRMSKCLTAHYNAPRVVKCTGNPWVFSAIPIPVPTKTHTRVMGTGFFTGQFSYTLTQPIPVPMVGNPWVCREIVMLFQNKKKIYTMDPSLSSSSSPSTSGRTVIAVMLRWSDGHRHVVGWWWWLGGWLGVREQAVVVVGCEGAGCGGGRVVVVEGEGAGCGVEWWGGCGCCGCWWGGCGPRLVSLVAPRRIWVAAERLWNILCESQKK
jgi:hypothetical protein